MVIWIKFFVIFNRYLKDKIVSHFLFSGLCNNRKCVEHSFCDDGKCKCDEGYHGNGYVQCERKYT